VVAGAKPPSGTPDQNTITGASNGIAATADQMYDPDAALMNARFETTGVHLKPRGGPQKPLAGVPGEPLRDRCGASWLCTTRDVAGNKGWGPTSRSCGRAATGIGSFRRDVTIRISEPTCVSKSERAFALAQPQPREIHAVFEPRVAF